MGGQVFATGADALVTPRLSPDSYRAVRDHCQEILRQHFVVVAVPIEGPGKKDFGDVDIFVAWPRQQLFPSSKWPPAVNMQTVYEALGAVRMKQDRPDSASVAIPLGPLLYKVKRPHDGTKKTYLQVDVHIFYSFEDLCWMLFKHAHGDVWNIIGSIIRPFGLTADERGLHVRIPEIEHVNKKEARVLLSRDPAEVLKFLGMRFDEDQWDKPFATVDDMFRYVATCRLFNAMGENKAKDEEGVDSLDEWIMNQKKKLRANDRRRLMSRPAFKKWVEEFVPKYIASSRHAYPPVTRDDVRHQAFVFFPGSQSIYISRLREWQIKRQRETLWNGVIKCAIPTDLDPHQRGVCAAAFKKIILHDDKSFHGIEAPPTLKYDSGMFNEDAVSAWVTDKWPLVMQTAWRINQERCAAKKREPSAGQKRTFSSTGKPSTSSSSEDSLECLRSCHSKTSSSEDSFRHMGSRSENRTTSSSEDSIEN
ncbi:hypothetical protein F5Y17DRAFT_168656 [Xylariaceae sp. FL0594]|nr:hypothetical protein F5Y17DRAFT_168656 [Xylariaceae sp. FL0594]